MERFPELPFDDWGGLAASGDAVLTLTMNNRHARRLMATSAAALPGHGVRQAPQLLPWSAWLRQAAQRLAFLPDADLAAHVLDASAARHVWSAVIRQAETERPLLDIGQAARLAMEADLLMSEWQLSVPDGCETQEYVRFRLWREAYRQSLAQLEAQDENQMIEAVVRAVGRAELTLPCRDVVLAGFTELSPRALALLQSLQDQGKTVWRLAQPPAMDVQALRVPVEDPDAQWRAAAAWAAERLRASPSGRYAIIAAQLEGDMPFAHRALREALGHDAAPGQAVPPAGAYNLSVARPLGEWPLARAALAWLRALTALTAGSGAAAMLGEALLAGACAGQRPEADARAGLDALWRRKTIQSLTAQAFAQSLSQRAPVLSQAWQAASALASGQRGRATLDAWVVRFRQELHALGFPGEGGVDSHAYQVLEALDDALVALGGQAFVHGALAREGALALVSQALDETLFQPMRDPAARLDVLGLLEAEGGRWDGAWVLGLTDDVMPAAAQPNPLLPLVVLRQAGTPRATPARELQWARHLLDDIAQCAPEILFSHARRRGEQPLRPSPLIQDYPEASAMRAAMPLSAHPDGGATAQSGPGPAVSSDVSASPCADAPHGQSLLECVQDDDGPALSGDAVAHGGIGVIDTQARNPLWAFVKYRLGASLLPGHAEGPDPSARGNFLHRAIELVWRMLPDQDALRQHWERDQAQSLIAQVTQRAAQECLPECGEVLLALELARACDILRGWLAFECERPTFRIHGLEDTRLWRQGALALRVRMDRVDLLEDGRLAVMDYKTGAGAIDPRSQWMRERPVGLQLPFYAAMLNDGAGDADAPCADGRMAGIAAARVGAIAAARAGGTDGVGRAAACQGDLPFAPDPQVAALVLARLHARGVELRGLSDGDCGLPGVATPVDWPLFAQDDWPMVMQRWRTAIAEVAREYAQGHAPNLTRNVADLAYCDVLPFLRLEEMQEAAQEAGRRFMQEDSHAD